VIFSPHETPLRRTRSEELVPLPSPSLESGSSKTSDPYRFSGDQPSLEGSTSNSAQFREDGLEEAGLLQELNDPEMHKNFDMAPEEKPRTRSGKFSNLPSWLKDYHPCTLVHVSFEPPSYEAAVTDPNLKKAMIQEMDAISKKGIWEVTKLPLGKRARSTK
jgi:hypothetical protein